MFAPGHLGGNRSRGNGAGIVVCDAGGTAAPRLRDPGDQEEGGRGLQVVDAVAAAWGCFRVGRAMAVWCDLGKPLDLPTSQTWAWLRPVFAAGALVTTETQPTSGGRATARQSSLLRLSHSGQIC